MLSAKKSKSVVQVEVYLHHCQFVRRLAVRSVNTYRKDLTRFISETGTRDFRRVTNDQLNDWQAMLAKEGKAGKTINNYRDAVVGCLKYLADNDQKVAINFGRVIRAEQEQRDAKCFTHEEVQQIKAACEGLRELLLISLLYDSWLRISELRYLKVEHVKELEISVVQGKGRKDRTAFIEEDTRVLLDRWQNLVGVTSGYLFPSPRKYGEPISDQQFRDWINTPVRRAGFEDGSAHTFRHAGISDRTDRGMDLVTAQRIAGHSDPRTTGRYVHRSSKRLGEIFHRFAPGDTAPL